MRLKRNMKKFEYLLHDLYNLEQLNQLGAEGWECVCRVGDIDMGDLGTSAQLLLKREVSTIKD